jgi:hypothetical protein
MMAGINNSSNATNNSWICTQPDTPSPVDEPKASSTFRVVAMALIISFSLAGNSLVCRGAMLRRNKPFSYYLIINLAVAELVITIMQPFYVVYKVKPFSWIFGNTMCYLVHSVGICATLVVTFTLAAIAVHRCIMMIQPYRHRPTHRAAYLIIACSWIWGIVLVIPEAFSIEITEFEICKKRVIFCTANADPIYSIVYYILFFAVPFTIILVSYGIVVFNLKKHIHTTRNVSLEMTTDDCKTRTSLTTDTEVRQGQHPEREDPHVSPEERMPAQEILQKRLSSNVSKNEGSQKSKMIKLETDALSMIYIIILIFFLCYLPSSIEDILLFMTDLPILDWRYIYIFDWYMHVLHALPSALHPICYGATSKVIGFNFRRPYQ